MEICGKFPLFSFIVRLFSLYLRHIHDAMIENTPKHNQKLLREAVKLIYDPETALLMKKINSSYLYWDKVKYMAPADVDPAVLWQAVKLQRIANAKAVTFGKYKFYFTVTEQMHAMLHEFDMNIGGSLGTNNLIPENDKNFYLVSSVMEEAIASSQMEGASTTRKVAKDMLRKNLKPRDKSQLMIANNYATIRYLSEHRDDEFTVERLLDIHRYISAGTLENKDDEGSIRQTDDIVVMDGITGDIAHTPPPHEEVAQLLEELCTFANNDSPDDFIHPIIKGIILHFMLAYIHPFVDGNGRTARSLVYWYMMKKGYWLTEYLSISRIIYTSKAKYERAFLYTEHDDNDLSYFIQFNLDTMKRAYEELKNYLQRKINERDSILMFKGVKGINQRQAHILKIITGKENEILTVKEVATRFNITGHTARTDLQGLVRQGLMDEIPLNNRLIGYVKSETYDEIIKHKIKGK